MSYWSERIVDMAATTDEKVEAYEASIEVFGGLLSEMRELSKKKPDASMSAMKVRLVNRVLEPLRDALNNEPEGKFLDLLDDEALPQVSDAVLVMVQFERAARSYRARYHNGRLASDSGSGWITVERQTQVRKNTSE